ncbi:MAG TPA: hypothetical protein VMW08_02445 [Acidimicrobiales bacterium]|nr:hypothetical protein [Acidimicrobiales bacterium]
MTIRRLLPALMATAFVIAACGSDSDATQTGSDVDPDDGVIVGQLDLGDGEAEGVFRRTVPLADDGDGVGVLHLTLDTDCRNDLGTGVPPLLSMVADDEVTVTDETDEVPFRFAGLADGTYFASGWVDDVDNPEQEEDLPATGDLVMFGDLSPRCVEFEVVDGAADPLVLELDYEMPFTLPGFEGDEGILAGDGKPSVDPSTIVDDGSTHTVTIEVTRSVEPDLGGDGVGPWYAGLFTSCFDDETGETPLPVFPSLRDELELVAIGEPVAITIEGVSNGVYFVNGFIDDATGQGEPRPGIGDLVAFGGFGPACAEVVVNGSDVSVAFDLNLVLPFDL